MEYIVDRFSYLKDSEEFFRCVFVAKDGEEAIGYVVIGAWGIWKYVHNDEFVEDERIIKILDRCQFRLIEGIENGKIVEMGM